MATDVTPAGPPVSNAVVASEPTAPLSTPPPPSPALAGDTLEQSSKSHHDALADFLSGVGNEIVLPESSEASVLQEFRVPIATDDARLAEIQADRLQTPFAAAEWGTMLQGLMGPDNAPLGVGGPTAALPIETLGPIAGNQDQTAVEVRRVGFDLLVSVEGSDTGLSVRLPITRRAPDAVRAALAASVEGAELLALAELPGEPAPREARLEVLADRSVQVDLPASVFAEVAPAGEYFGSPIRSLRTDAPVDVEPSDAWTRVVLSPTRSRAYDIGTEMTTDSRRTYHAESLAVEWLQSNPLALPEWHPIRAEHDAVAAVSDGAPIAFASSDWGPAVNTTHIAVLPSALPEDIRSSLVGYGEFSDGPLVFDLTLSASGAMALAVARRTQETLALEGTTGTVAGTGLLLSNLVPSYVQLRGTEQREIAALALQGLNETALAGHPALREFAQINASDEAFRARGVPSDPAERVVYRAMSPVGYRAEWEEAARTFGHEPFRYIGYVDNLREKPIVDDLLRAANGEVDPAFLYTVALGEGLVLQLNGWTSGLAGLEIPESIDGFGVLGIDFFGAEVDELRSQGFLPEAFQEGTHYITRLAVNEKGESVLSAVIVASPDGESALYNSLVAVKAVIRSREAQARRALGRDFHNDTERFFATYYTFDAGVGGFRDYLASGPVVRRYSGERLTSASRHALANTAARMATWQHLSRVVFRR